MSDVLFLAHRIPYPPNKGDKIRSWHMLRHLLNSHRVHLGYFIDDPADAVHVPFLEQRTASHCACPIDPRWGRVKSLAGLATGTPLSVAFYRSRAMRDWVDRVMETEPISAVVLFSSAVAQFLLPWSGRVPLIMDFVDMDSDKWRQYAGSRPWPISLVYGREARTLADYERRIAQVARHSLFVSGQEADLFRAQVPEVAGSVRALHNGVDIDYFDPAVTHDDPYGTGGPVAVFTGAMDYWANVDAVTWFAQDIWPQVRRQLPDARFFIVGGRPAPTVRALDRLDGVAVTGRVPDVRPYLAHAATVVAPMRIARGVQNKVLEGMAMAKPVVTTPAGLEGIAATPGRDVLVADTADAFASEAAAALSGARDSLGREARRTIVGRYSWEASLQTLDDVLQMAECA